MSTNSQVFAPVYLNRKISEAPRFKAYSLRNYKQLPQFQKLSAEQIFAIEVVGRVLPFKTNRYIVDELIDWDHIPDDPFFILTFPQQEMLLPHHFEAIANLLKKSASEGQIQETANRIRWELNPHPGGQLESNLPYLEGEKLRGMQHKYRETVLYFPKQGQTCYAYCTFCFRWPQFVDMNEIKFAMHDSELLVAYLRKHPEVTDVLFTGGDPLIMKTAVLSEYMDTLLEADLPGLNTIRIGTKTLASWPFRFLTDVDAGELLDLFRKIGRSGKHLAIMAHFNHPRELETDITQEAIMRIRETGAQIRTQSPLLAHINDVPDLWSRMWREQVKQGCVPYYMFVVRDTGAQHYFRIPLAHTWEIFQKAYQTVSGLARTVHGPCMSAHPGKVQILGVNQVSEQKVFTLRFLQGRNPDWVLKPFFAQFDEQAFWLDDLKPAFGEERFFFDIKEIGNGVRL